MNHPADTGLSGMFVIERVELVTLESLSPYTGPRITNEVEYATLIA